jgi:hypothetical protein
LAGSLVGIPVGAVGWLVGAWAFDRLRLWLGPESAEAVEALVGLIATFFRGGWVGVDPE